MRLRPLPPSASATPTRPLRAVVVGGGPGGLSTALALARNPRFRVDVFEARPEADATNGADERRTYGMVLGAARALGPLIDAGVDVGPMTEGRRLAATAMFSGAADGPGAISRLAPPDADEATLNSAATSRDPAALFMVDRAHMVGCLAAAATATGRIDVHWGAPLRSLDVGARVVEFDGCAASRYDLLVAADGGASATRAALVAAGVLTTSELPSPVSATNYRTFHGLSDEGAASLGLDVSGRATTFAIFSPPPTPPGVKGAPYAGSMVVHRRPGGRGWSGLLSQSAGVYESLPAGSGPEDFAPLLDGVLGARSASFPAAWRSSILAQISVPGAETGKLARLVRASRLAVPAGGVALVGDAATTNTPQLGQGAASALEDGAVLAADVTKALAGVASSDEAAERAAIAHALISFDTTRRPARYALQDMERELAVTNRPPPLSEPPEDAAARDAWKAFFAAQRRVAAWRAAVKRVVARVLPFSSRARAAAAAPEMAWWNATLHGTVPFDQIYERVRGRRVGGV